MSRKNISVYSKMLAPAVAAALVVGIATINACSPSDRSTESREDAMSQNAAEAEAAEAQLASADAQKAGKKGDQKDAKKETQKVATTDAKKAHGSDKAAATTEHKTADTKKPTRNVASAGGGVYVVQVGAFKVKENAEKLQAKLKEAGYSAEMRSIEHSKNGLLHLVSLEPVQSRAEAETVVEDLHAKHDMNPIVVQATR